jgi:thiol-disulfide isomerase/thioredoxin
MAPDLSLTDAGGRSVKLSGSRGKIVLLNFWATWCGGCQTETPWFIEFQKQYGNARLEVIGVPMDSDGWKSVKPYIKEKSVNYRDRHRRRGEAVENRSDARNLLVDYEGRIAATHVGLAAKAAYRLEIESGQ